MAVTFHHATQTAGPASVGTKVIAHTLSAAGATVLVWTHANGTVTISGVAAGTQVFTRLGAVSAGGSRAELWGLSAAQTSATLSISVNTVGAASLNYAVVVTSYLGARQQGGSPFGTFVGGTAGVVSTVDLSVSSTATDLVVWGFGRSGAGTLVVNNGTTRASASHTTTGRLVVGDIAGASTVSVSATAGSVTAGSTITWTMIGQPLVASATAAATTIAFDNAAGTFTTGAVATFGLLLTATSDAVLLVWAQVDQDGGISAINVNTSQLTRITAVSAAAPLKLELWGLTAPPSGVLTISAVLADGAEFPMGIAAATYVGHRTTDTPFGGAAVTSGSALSMRVSISSTAGNVVVMGGGTRAFDPVSWSAFPSMTQRFGSPTYPAIIIADVPGQAAITAGARLFTASAHLLIAINLIQSGAATFTSGIGTMTDPADVFSASGYVIVSGRISATDAPDRFTAPAKVIIQGSISALDVVDTLSAAAKVRISGRLSATEAADTLSVSGYTLVHGRLSATDAQDLFSASGNMGAVTAFISATEADDLLSASGYVLIQGRISATEASDIFSASGTAISEFIVGRVSATDVTDTLAASGYVLVSGNISFTDPADVLSASGYVIISGSVNFTDQPDIFSASGYAVPVSVSVADAVVVDTSAGHGKKQKEYFRADEAFWTAREKYLKTIHKAISAEPEVTIDVPVTASISNTVPDPNPVNVSPVLLAELRMMRSKTISAMPAATSMRQLRPLGKRLYELNAKIAEQKRLALQREIEYQQRIERNKARKRIVRKAKRKVVMLAAARAVAALSYLHTQI